MLLILTRSPNFPSNELLAQELKAQQQSFEFFNPFAQNYSLELDIIPSSVLIRSSGILFDDWDLSLMESWQNKGIKISNSPQAMRALRDKDRQYLHLKSAKLSPFPTAIMRGEVNKEWLERLYSQFKRETARFLIKSSRSNGGRGQTLIDNEEQLQNKWHEFTSSNDQRYIIQPFMEHFDELRVFMINNQIIACAKKCPLSDHHNPGEWRHNASYTQFQACSSPPEIKKLCANIVRYFELDYTAIDLVYWNNKWWVMEVNGLPGWSELESSTKIPITKLLIESMI